MRDQDFASVADAFRDSLAYRMSRVLIERSIIAADQSVALSRIGAGWRSFASRSAQRQLQTIATTLAIASVVHLAIRELLPRYATSGLPWWWSVTVAAFAAIIAMLAGPISSAFADSTPAKWSRRLTS